MYAADYLGEIALECQVKNICFLQGRQLKKTIAFSVPCELPYQEFTSDSFGLCFNLEVPNATLKGTPLVLFTIKPSSSDYRE